MVWELPCGDYIIGVDPGSSYGSWTNITVSGVGAWSVNDHHHIQFFHNAYIPVGTELLKQFMLSFSPDDLGAPGTEEWWTNLIDAIGRKANYIKEEFLL